jgi:hypothetical protein
LLVTADAGFGKSALLAYYVEKLRSQGYPVAYHFFNQRDNATCNVSRAYRNLLEQLYPYFGFSHRQIPTSEADRRIELYNLVRDNLIETGKALFIVIDALDEAESPFLPPFPIDLPENVFVIASIRAGVKTTSSDRWADPAETVAIDRLPHEAIVTWLERSDTTQLVGLAEDRDFVNQLDEITQGYPLYLRHLIDELNHAVQNGQDVRSVLRETPKGFRQYVKSQLRKLDTLDLPKERQQFFALLATAKGALEKTDVKAITGMDRSSFQKLHDIWQVTRWLKISEDGLLYAFAHPRLGEAFAAELEEDADDAEQDLIKYCEQWQNHQSRYALRYYAEHLKQKGRWDQLFGLARNSEFSEAQRRAFMNEPSLLLKTAQTSLQGAIETDSPVAISEFLLQCAHQLSKIIEQDPLLVLRLGNTNLSLELIDLNQSLESYISWALILVWELKEIEREEDARDILRKVHDRLQDKEFHDFSSKEFWQGSLVAHALAYVFELDSLVCASLSRKLFGEHTINGDTREWGTLCQALCDRGLITEAVELRKEQHNFFTLVELAEMQARRGDLEASETTYLKIFSFTRNWRDATWRIARSAKNLVEMGYGRLARQIFLHLLQEARKIEVFEHQVEMLLTISDSQMEASEWEDSLIYEALEILDKISLNAIENLSLKAKLLEKKAKLYAQSVSSSLAENPSDQSKNYFKQALEVVQTITDEEERQAALEHLVYDQVSVNFTDDALETVQQMVDDSRRSSAIVQILDRYLTDLNFVSAFKIVSQFYQDDDKAGVLQRIAQAQAQAHKIQEATETAELVSDDLHKSYAWTSIIEAQVQIWYEFQDKSVTIDEIFKTVEEKFTTPHYKDDALKAIASIQLRHKDFTAATQTLNKLKHPDELAIAHAKNNDFEQALAIIRQIRDPRIQLETFEKVARVQLKAGQSYGARTTYAEILATLEKSESFRLRCVALLNIADTQLEMGQNQAAISTLRKVDKYLNSVDDAFSKSYYLGVLAEQWKQVGNLEVSREYLNQASILAEDYSERNLRTLSSLEIFARLAISQAKAGSFDVALATAEKIIPPSLKSEVYRAMADIYAKNNSFISRETLQESLVKGYEEFENDPGYPGDNPVRTFCNWAVARFTIGDGLASQQILSKLYQEVKEYKVRKARLRYLALVAIAYAQTANLNTSISMLPEIETSSWKIRVIWVIAYTQFKQNLSASVIQQSLSLATQTYQEIQDKKQRAESLGTLAKIQALTGEYSKALSSIESIPDQRAELLSSLANIFIDTGDIESLKRLIIPCSCYLDSAYDLCPALVKLYPEHSEAIAELVSKDSVA